MAGDLHAPEITFGATDVKLISSGKIIGSGRARACSLQLQGWTRGGLAALGEG
jgi:hypothetical protein